MTHAFVVDDVGGVVGVDGRGDELHFLTLVSSHARLFFGLEKKNLTMHSEVGTHAHAPPRAKSPKLPIPPREVLIGCV